MSNRPQRLLGEALEFSWRNYPLKTAAIYKDKEYSYSDLKGAAENLAFHLVNSGIIKGDRVAICMNNSWHCIVSIYGVSFAGAVFLVINPQTKANKLQYILNDCGAKVLISEGNLMPEVSIALEGLEEIQEVIISEGNQTNTELISGFIDFNKVISPFQTKAILPRIIPNDLAALIYTSGSTGFPKGVMMTHQSMVFTSWR
jgi:long-chain acyl-CoA synthetase